MQDIRRCFAGITRRNVRDNADLPGDAMQKFPCHGTETTGNRDETPKQKGRTRWPAPMNFALSDRRADRCRAPNRL
jgi:hypothetical protein